MSTRRAHVVRTLQWTLGILVLLAVGYALARNWAAVSGYLRQVSVRALVLGFAFSLTAPVCAMLGWRVLLGELGSPIARGPAAGMFFVGQLAKYLPGSVWSVVAQAEIGARLQIPRRRTAVVALISIGMAGITAMLLGLPVLPVVLGPGESFAPVWAVAAVVVPLGLFLLWPRVLNFLIGLGLRVLRREPLEHRLSGSAVLRSSAWFLLGWCAAGAQTYVVAHDLAPSADRADLVVLSVCGFALASAIGMASAVFPAGVGIRDGALVILLASLMPTPAATAVAVLVRFFAVLADVVWAGAGWAWARHHHLVSTRAELEQRGITGGADDIEEMEHELEEGVAEELDHVDDGRS
jgi:hypothetical protein